MATTAVPASAEIQQTVDLLQSSERELAAHCATLAPQDWDQSDGAGRWSQVGILEHLLIAEEGLLARLKGLIAGPADPDWQARTESKDTLLPGVAEATTKVNAPPPLHPSGGKSPRELLSAFHAARADTIAFASRPGVPFKQYTVEHPTLGPMNGLQMLRTVGYHTLRHLGQMKRCARAGGRAAN